MMDDNKSGALKALLAQMAIDFAHPLKDTNRVVQWFLRLFKYVRGLEGLLTDVHNGWVTINDAAATGKIAELEHTLSTWREYALHLEGKLGMNNDDGEV